MPKYINISKNTACTIDTVSDYLNKGLCDKSKISTQKNSILVTVRKANGTDRIIVTVNKGKIVIGATPSVGIVVALSLVKLGIAMYFFFTVGMLAGIVALSIMYTIFIAVISRYWNASAELVKQQLERVF